MTGTISIELPNHFRKGQCLKCPLREILDFDENEQDEISCSLNDEMSVKLGYSHNWAKKKGIRNKVFFTNCPIVFENKRDCNTCNQDKRLCIYCIEEDSMYRGE